MKIKTIRLHEDTHTRLEKLLGRRESFDHLLQRMCTILESLQVIPDTLGPQHPLVAGREPDFEAIRAQRKGG